MRTPPSSQTIDLVLAGETIRLHAHAAMYWIRTETLIVADLHLGKATHFRRHGLAVPQYVQDETLEKLSGLLLEVAPKRLLILGDLFHADYNEEWEDFADLIVGFSDIAVALVPGNHDRLTHHQFEKYGIAVHPEPYVEGPFAFSHHPHSSDQLEAALGKTGAQGRYNLAGHVHPSARLRGRGDRLKLPCFFFGQSAGLLPAFGSFTGTFVVHPKRNDRVFVLAGDQVLDVAG